MQPDWAKVLGELLADHEITFGRKIEPMVARLAELEARPPVQPAPQGDIGPPGPPGPPGPQGEPGEISKAMLPPELAAEVAGAVRMLHEAPPLVQRSEPPPPWAPRLTRIERDADGSFVPVYDGTPPS